MIDGWISLSRKLTEWEWYSDTNVVRLFLHLLLTANFRDTPWHGIVIKRGQIVSSRNKISLQLNMSVKQIRIAEHKLASSGSVGIEGANRFTIYTIVKYDEYQTEDKRRANKGHSEGNQKANKGQQLKKDKKETIEETPTPLPEWMPLDLWAAYLEMRKQKGSPATERAQIILIAKLDSWRAKGHDPSAVLENSITGNWTNLYEPKGQNHGNTKTKYQRTIDAFQQAITERESAEQTGA